LPGEDEPDTLSNDVYPSEADLSSIQAAEKWCDNHPDARETGDPNDDVTLTGVQECSKQILKNKGK
jgi:hypothetical protein